MSLQPHGKNYKCSDAPLFKRVSKLKKNQATRYNCSYDPQATSYNCSYDLQATRYNNFIVVTIQLKSVPAGEIFIIDITSNCNRGKTASS